MFWSVAVHSLIVCALVVTPAAKLYALIHDVASEATIGDILSPLKSSTIKEIEFQVYCHTLRKWNIPLPSPAIVAEVHRADEDAFLGELGAGIAPEGGHFLHRHRRIPPAAVRLTRSYIRKMQAVRNREQWEVAQFMRLYSSLRQEK